MSSAGHCQDVTRPVGFRVVGAGRREGAVHQGVDEQAARGDAVRVLPRAILARCRMFSEVRSLHSLVALISSRGLVTLQPSARAKRHLPGRDLR